MKILGKMFNFGARFRVYITGGISCVTLLTILQTSNASPLIFGGTLSPVPVASVDPSATVLNSMTKTFTALDYSGTLFSEVLANDTANPNGGLTFYYQITMSANTVDPIGQMSISSFGNFLTDVGYVPSFPSTGLDTIPTSASRSGNGNVVRFNFTNGGGLGAGLTSVLLVIQTDAQTWQFTSAGFLDGSPATADSLAPGPIVVVPEPSSIAIGSTGLIGLMLLKFRRKLAGVTK